MNPDDTVARYMLNTAATAENTRTDEALLRIFSIAQAAPIKASQKVTAPKDNTYFEKDSFDNEIVLNIE